MTKQTFKIENEEIINLIEGLQVEVNARKDLLAFMLQNDMVNTASAAYETYHKEYMQFYVQLDEAKQEFQKAFVDPIPGAVNWTLDFNTKEVTVMVN